MKQQARCAGCDVGLPFIATEGRPALCLKCCDSYRDRDGYSYLPELSEICGCGSDFLVAFGTNGISVNRRFCPACVAGVRPRQYTPPRGWPRCDDCEAPVLHPAGYFGRYPILIAGLCPPCFEWAKKRAALEKAS